MDNTRVASSTGHTLGMPRTVREIITLLEKDGWVHVRTKGSHRQYKHFVKPGVITVPGKLSRDLRPGLEQSILRKAQLTRGGQT